MAVNSSQSSKASPPARVQIEGLSRTFQRTGGDYVTALDNISIDVYDGEILVLLGPSGCGKSTLLRSIAGLESPDRGSIRIADIVVFSDHTDVPPNQRDVNMMFQSYALWPHMTLRQNVAYPLRVGGQKRRPAERRADQYLDLVGLAGLGDEYAGNISGGQSQRVALARTLVSEPAVVLLDEPLSNVDARVRSTLRSELVRLHGELGFSAVYVTHDQVEALGIGHRIALMRNGGVEQVGTPRKIYATPQSRYAAEFIGDANIIEGNIAKVGTDEVLVSNPVVGNVALATDALVATVGTPTLGEPLLLMIRPEHCAVQSQHQDGKENAIAWTGVIETAIYAGAHTEFICDVSGLRLTAWSSGPGDRPEAGDEVLFCASTAAVHPVRP